MKRNNTMYTIDELAKQASGYFSMPIPNDMTYTDLLFDICRQFGIHYYSATPKGKAFVEEVTRITWAKEQESLIRAKQYTLKYIKGITGNKLLKEFSEIRKSLWMDKLWNGSYFCETISSTSEEKTPSQILCKPLRRCKIEI